MTIDEAFAHLGEPALTAARDAARLAPRLTPNQKAELRVLLRRFPTPLPTAPAAPVDQVA